MAQHHSGEKATGVDSVQRVFADQPSTPSLSETMKERRGARKIEINQRLLNVVTASLVGSLKYRRIGEETMSRITLCLLVTAVAMQTSPGDLRTPNNVVEVSSLTQPRAGPVLDN
ncbi:hypothetical protein LSAT2_000719 [Lamellibrachia satsuma]|nr:hypothetical protein LSAT2_000719 [Lamellibrachia satsuma]